MSRIREIETINNGFVSVENSTNNPLIGSGVFDGDWEDTLNYNVIIIGIIADQDSATDGMVIQWSADGVSVVQTDVFTIFADSGKVFTFSPANRYFKIVYTNGITLQTEFNIQPIFKKAGFKPSSHRIDDEILAQDDATLTTTVLKVIADDPDRYVNVDVQHPLPADGDSVYLKDVDVSNSDNGGFSGDVTCYFDSLKTVNNDPSATNPKIIKIWFNRSLQTNSIGFGCDDLTKSFSNIVIKALGSGEEVRYTKDLSADDTKRNSYVVDLPPLALNGVIIEFHTADEIGLSNLIIWKATDVNARLSAVSSLTQTVEDIGSFRAALDVNQALVHREGINEYFKRDLGGATTLAVAVTAGDVDIDVVSVVGFAISDYIRLSGPTSVQRGHFKILNVVGTVITLNRPIDTDMDIGDDVTEIDISLNKLGTQAAPISSKIKPESYERWQITRLLITMIDATVMDDGKFGGAPALPNGFVIRTVRNGVVATNAIWNSNQDLKDDMFNVDYSDKAPAGQYGLSGRWTLTESEFVADLDGSTGDYLEVLNQDNLTVLLDYKIKAQGRLFGG